MYNINNKILLYILLCLGCVSISFNVAAITAVIPGISSDLQQPDFLVSRMIPFYMIPYGISALIYAPLTRFLSYRKVLAVTLAGFALACFISGMARSLNALLFARILMGITGAATIPLGLMVIGECFEKGVRGRLVGGFFSCSFIASLAGIFLSGFALWRWLFFIPAGLAFITALSFVLFDSDLIKKKHGGGINYLKVFENISIRNVFLFIGVISLLYHGVHKWFGIYFYRVYSMDKLTISFYFVLSAVGGFSGQIVGGILSDKRGRDVSCYAGLIGLAGATMLLFFQLAPVALAVVIFLLSMSWTVGHNGISTVLTDFSEENRSMIASLNSSVRFVAGGIGFFISSFFVEKSFSLTFLVFGVLMALLVFSLPKVIVRK